MIGAVNTVWYENGTLIGGNTDWLGIVLSLDAIHPGWDAVAGRSSCSAPAARRAPRSTVFLERGFSVSIVNRTLARAPNNLRPISARAPPRMTSTRLPHLLAEADVLINNTSLGMTGNPPLAIDLAPLKPLGDRL